MPILFAQTVLLSVWVFFFFVVLYGPRVGTRGLEPLRGHPGKRGLLEASEWRTLFSRSVENGHPSPRPLKSLPRGPESLSGALRGLWEGVSETPRLTETRGRIPRPLRGPKTSGPLSRVSPLLFRPSGT